MSCYAERAPKDVHVQLSIDALNFYGQPIISPEYFDGEHVANVPEIAGLPPVCSCGWTRREVDGRWFEMADHLAEQESAEE